MMSILRRSIGLFLVATVAACAPASSLRVMTFNVRLSYDEGPTRWDVRRPVMVATIRDTQPDVIGTQELLKSQGDDIVPIPGTKRTRYLDENLGALSVELSSDQLERLSTLRPAGDRYSDMDWVAGRSS